MKPSFWTKLFDLIAPRCCAICGDRLSCTESALCAVCTLHLPYTGFELSPYDNPMARLFWGLFPVEKATALFFYEPHSEMAGMIYDMKYHAQPELCEDMGVLAANYLSRSSSFFDTIDAIVPVPITARRRRQRGYNQSMEISRGISRVVGLPIYDKVVKRTRFLDSQTKKDARQRRSNVEDAFLLRNADGIAHRHLLLVDDIVTTGATLTACAQQLQQADDVKISILTLGFTK